jgi:DNA-binding MarR family transcriptional regulator
MKGNELQASCLASRGLLGAILLVTRELRVALDRRMAPYGLTFQQASLLIRCVHNNGASLNQLMPHLGTDNAGVSRLVDRLEAANLVERTRGSDRRSLALQATEKGIALAPKLGAVFSDVNRELIAGLSREETAVAYELLRRILGNVGSLNREGPSTIGGSQCQTE